MNKLAMKLATSVVAFATMFVVAIPVFAAVDIDYEKEQITGLATTQEYSFDKKIWFGVYDAAAKIDLKPVIKNTGSVNFYYRTIDAPLADDITTLPIPSRPAAPKGIRFAPKATTDKDVITTNDTHEVKHGYSLWVASPQDGAFVGDFETNGAVISIRTEAVIGSSFTSAESTLKINKKRAKPASAKYDVKTDGVVVANGMEYQIGTRPATTAAAPSAIKDDDWKAVGSTKKLVTRADIDDALKSLSTPEGSAAYVYVRLKNTATLAVSEYASIKVPAIVAAPTTPDLVIADEKLKTVSSLMEYRVLTVKSAATATYSSPKWTAITSSEQDISKSISPATSKTPNVIIQVRFKAVPGSGTTLDKPASAVKELQMGKRPATPKITDLVLNYDPSALTMTVATTNEWKYDTAAKWTDGGTDVDIKSKVPSRGTPAAKVFVRVKAVEVTGASDIDVPASLPFKGGKINPTPAAPKTPVFNKKSKKITGVTSKMEFAIGTNSSWEPVVGSFIDLTSQSEGTSGIVKVRLKNTATAPISEEKYVDYEIPVKK